MNWRLASNVLSRPSQVPWIGNATAQQGGIWAATIRYRQGIFYIATIFTYRDPWVLHGVIFTSTDPYNDATCGEPVVYDATEIDPDLFWDDDGQLYITSGGINQQTIDLTTGKVSKPYRVWNGTGMSNPEGPHIYKKDGYYYLMIAEGGTEMGHSVTIARSTKVSGPYENYSKNPILTNKNTTQYFHTVGHADLFQDASGNWWGTSLATRSGPEWVNYPMGRETVLFPVSWETGKWPVLQPVRGHMSGWPLPKATRDVPGIGPFVQDPDVVNFVPGSAIPNHFVYWRFPKPDTYTVSPQGHPDTLRLRPSRTNLTSNTDLGLAAYQTFISRRQVDTLFTYSVDVMFDPKIEEEEVGITVFLTQMQHIDMGIVLLPSQSLTRAIGSELIPHFRFRATDIGHANARLPATLITPIPQSWLTKSIRLEISTINETHYSFFAAPTDQLENSRLLGIAPATIVSGGNGPMECNFKGM